MFLFVFVFTGTVNVKAQIENLTLPDLFQANKRKTKKCKRRFWSYLIELWRSSHPYLTQL